MCFQQALTLWKLIQTTTNTFSCLLSVCLLFPFVSTHAHHQRTPVFDVLCEKHYNYLTAVQYCLIRYAVLNQGLVE